MQASRATAAIITLAVLAACAAPVHVAPEERLDASVEIPGPDYRGEGTVAFASRTGEMVSPRGCTLAFTRLVPQATSPAGPRARVVLSPGFLRSRTTIQGLATHLASWGADVTTVDPCSGSLISGGHEDNAVALGALVRHLGLQRVTYAGFSAGALAALLAARADSDAAGVLLLDLVDAGALAARTTDIRAPVYALVGEPSACNARSDALPALAAMPAARVLHVTGASHCHFEFPLDATCTRLCSGTSDPHALAPLQGLILGLATAAVLQDTGDWWEPDGPVLRQLLSAGRVRLPGR